MPYKQKSSSEYPDSYFKVLELFSEGQKDIQIPMTYREACSRRHHFYRFFKALAVDYTKDVYIKRMSDIANTVIISIQPSTARNNEIVELLFYINPIELALGDKPIYEDTDAPIVPGASGDTYDPLEIEKLISEKHEGEEDG